MRYLRLLGILGIVVVLMACTTTSEPTPDIPATVAAQVQLQLAATPAPTPTPVIDVPRTHATPLPPAIVMPPIATPLPSLFPLRAATPEPTIFIPLPYVVVAPPTPVITPIWMPEPPATPITYPTVPVERAVMATMEPFPTAAPVEPVPAAEPILEHPVAWKVRNPRDGLYSINLPADWEHDESRQSPDGQVFLESFADPGYTAQLTVVDYPPREDYDVSHAFANVVAQFNEVTGFEVLTIDQVSDEVTRVVFLYDGTGPGCEVVTFYGVLTVTASHSFQLGLDICSPPGADSHRAAFADQVMDGFKYPGQTP